MIGEERCDCCDLPVTSCGRQAEKRQRADAQRETARIVSAGGFRSTWPGQCAGCDEHFAAQSLIVGDPSGGYLAECCA